MFLNSTLALFFSNKVIPIKVPSPRPVLDLSWFDEVRIYGCPNLSIISSGKPDPSSLTKTSDNFSLLFIITSIL